VIVQWYTVGMNVRTVVTVTLGGLLIGFWTAWAYGMYTESTAPNLQEDLALLSQVEQSFPSLDNFFADFSKEQGAVLAFQLLRAAALPPNIDLHLLGHTIGDELYRQEGLDGMALCTNDFRNACSHSVVIGALLENGMSVFDTVNDVCKEAPGGSGAYTMCFHGFGHGVLAYTEYDFEAAIDLCERTGTAAYNYRESAECIGGMVMEMNDGIHDPEVWQEQYALFVDTENPLSICQVSYMPEHAKERCYSYVTPYLFDAAAGGDSGLPTPDIFADAFAYCAAEPNEVHRRECYAGFGKEFIVLVNDYDIQNIETISNERLERLIGWCALAGNQVGNEECLLEVVNSLYWGGENDYLVSIRYCTLLPDDVTDACFVALFDNVANYRRDPVYQRQFCTDVPEAFTEQCTAYLL